MGDDSEVSAGALMRGAPGADVVREALVLATLERDLFGRRSPAPVLDRYVLLEKIGAGGLGVVFKAYDPDLDRQVALKLLRVREDAVVPEASVLLDEARMMAKVAHPNVLTIHDVGTYTRRDLGIVAESQDHLGIPMPGVFLVTEFMERGSLRDVLKRSPPFADVMPMLLAAGRGVAAAHARGIVHRDFKPGNVLIGADGGVCVGDFGLALPVAKFEATGDPAGTPAYMAPEQLRGDVADARSDQYAFALTCYQAVYGCQPFPAGGSSSGLRRSPEPGASRKIPRRIHAVLRRALQDDPAARYPDMPRLLRALESAMVHRGRRAFAVGGGVVVLAGFAALPWIDESQDDPCAQAGQAIDEVWNEDVRAQLAVSFRAPGAESAQMTGVAGAVDAYALRWREAERTACADTHVRRVQSEARLDERTACLERRRLELGQAIRLMLEADSAVLANSMRLVHSLEWIETCSDPRRTEFARRVPDDPQARAAVAEVWGQLGRARLLELSGRYAEAAAMAATARDAARDLGEDSSFAAAHVRLGSIKARMGDYPSARAELLRGIQLAESASDDQTSVDGWIRLLWVAGVELQDGQGETWGGFARAALDRLGDDPMREAQLDHNLGGMAYREARFEDALAHYQRALDTQQRLLGDDDPRVARTLNHIANVLLEMRVLDRALDYARRSLEIRKRVLGAGHPQVAASLNNIASAHLGRQAYAEAGEALAQSLAITEGTGLPQETVARALSERLTVARTTQAPASHGR